MYLQNCLGRKSLTKLTVLLCTFPGDQESLLMQQHQGYRSRDTKGGTGEMRIPHVSLFMPLYSCRANRRAKLPNETGKSFAMGKNKKRTSPLCDHSGFNKHNIRKEKIMTTSHLESCLKTFI